MGTTFGDQLRAARTERKISLAELGDAVSYHRSAVANVEAGRRDPDRRFAVSADRFLAAQGRLVAAWDRDDAMRADTVKQRRLQRQAAAESVEIAAEVVDSAGLAQQAVTLGVDYLRGTPADMLRRATHARRAATTQLRRGGHTATTHADLLVTVSRLSGVLAYAALDLGDTRQAFAHTEAAWRCADLAGDAELLAWTRGTQSLIARFNNEFPRALWLAQDGMQYAVTGSGAARLFCGQAQSSAGLGDGPGAVAALHRAETVREGDPREDAGEGIFSFREVKQRYYAGSSLLWTDREQDLRSAEREALAAVQTWERSPVDERSLGDEALARVYVAIARAQLGELEGTREALTPILDLPEGRRISWIGKRMANVAEIVAGDRYRSSPAARHLHEELTAYAR